MGRIQYTGALRASYTAYNHLVSGLIHTGAYYSIEQSVSGILKVTFLSFTHSITEISSFFFKKKNIHIYIYTYIHGEEDYLQLWVFSLI